MKSIALSLVLLSTLNAGVYDYGYNGLKEVADADKNNTLYYGEYERIIRYDAINYTPGNPVTFNAETSDMDKMYESINGYVEAKVPYTISVIGHTRRDKEVNHEVAQESTFFGSLQNTLMESVSDSEENRAVCDRAIAEIKKQLIDHHVAENNIVTECREGSQPLYLENDENARALNYRVMVTLYAPKVAKPAPKVVPKTISAPEPKVEIDSDGDGVVDANDKCPNTPKGYTVDENGCPREVTLHINFPTASAVIPKSSSAQIDELKRFMHDYPMYRIEIVGHTDNVGSESSNQSLSLRRAKALENVLIDDAIAPERISSSGMGENAPVASNDDEEGRAQNRRTEVKMYMNSGK
ncbi:MAG: OmpA family protein [Sulfuricurvum sp.]